MGLIRTFFRRFVSRALYAIFCTTGAIALLPATAGAAAVNHFDRSGMPHQPMAVAGARLQPPPEQTGHGSVDVTSTRRGLPQQPAPSGAAPAFTDLYDVTWEEIPMPEITPAAPHVVTTTSIANDGTIAGLDGEGLVLWHPQTQAWEHVPAALALAPVVISPDGSSVVATGDSGTQPESTNVLTWSRATGWQALAGAAADQSTVYGLSRNFRFATGSGGNVGDASQAWVWAVDGGTQQLLPTPDSAFSTSASAVSEDGSVVIGNGTRFPRNGGDWPEDVAVRWVEGGPPTTLRDPDGNELYGASACNADCSIIFGSGDIFSSPSWFLKNNGEFGSFGTLPDGETAPYQYYVSGASPDGSLVAGLYSAKADPDNPHSNAYAYMPFLWTPATGLVSLRSLGIEVDWGDFPALQLSSDARHLLIGPALDPWDERTRNWAVVVNLMPKAARPEGGHSGHGRPASPAPKRNGSFRAGPATAVD